MADVPPPPKALIYTTSKGARAELRYDGETMWCTQAEMAELFGTTKQVVSYHLKNVLDDGELEQESVVKEILTTASDGKQYNTLNYNLDAIISVGYRVNSKQGTIFRKWATGALVQLLTKGFVVDSERLKGNADRIAELRDIIRDIRADESNVYAELKRIVAMCQDYDPRSKASINFFANFQNRMLYAITRRTAAEIIVSRADASKENMGLETWKGDHPLQSDAEVAKNYLGPIEIEDLNRLTTMVLDFFEDQTKREFLVTMDDADAKLGEILAVNRRHLLKGLGSVSAAKAEDYAHEQYKTYKEEKRMKTITTLNKTVKELPKLKRKVQKKAGSKA